MNIQPKQGLGCVVVGGSGGAVDLKTQSKLVWAFVKAIAKLVDMVMSVYIMIFM